MPVENFIELLKDLSSETLNQLEAALTLELQRRENYETELVDFLQKLDDEGLELRIGEDTYLTINNYEFTISAKDK